VAASGGMIEHLVYFNEYPIKFALITFVEVLIQALLMGQIISRLDKKKSGLIFFHLSLVCNAQSLKYTMELLRCKVKNGYEVRKGNAKVCL